MRRAFLFLLSAAAGAWAQDGGGLEGTSSFQYIETLVFARPAGLAGAYTSLASGVDAVGYNPAGVSRADEGRTVSGTFRYHFLDIASGNVAYGYPGAHDIDYAFCAAYINYGRIDEMDENGVASGNQLTPVSFNPSFTAAYKVSDRARIGATVKGLSEYLGDFAGSQLAVGWGVDLGMQYHPAVKNLGFGLALLNLGRQEQPHFTGGATGAPLPMSLKGGMFYSPLELPKARLAVDAEVPLRDAALLSGGIEYAYSPALTLRAGSRIDWNEAGYYLGKVADQNPGELEGGNALKLASGFTFQSDGVAVDYAVQYWYGLSWVHVLTLRYTVL